MVIDSHCHLDYLAKDEPVEEVVARSRDAGVHGLLTISTRLTTFPEVRAIAERFEDVWCTVGVHPHDAGAEGQSDPERLVELARHPKVVGIGESGLDYFYDKSPRDRQAESFRAHIEACQETGLPLVVHARDADEDVAAILQEGYAKKPYGGVLHCFSSGMGLAKAGLEIGFYVSFSGILTFRNAEAIREVALAVPEDRLLVETDAPYLAPVPKRGKRNEPAFVRHTLAKLAELRGRSEVEMAAITTENFHRLFPLTRDGLRGSGTGQS